MAACRTCVEGHERRIDDFGERDAISHLDLHPLTVLIEADEPVVIDWEMAQRGPAETASPPRPSTDPSAGNGHGCRP